MSRSAIQAKGKKSKSPLVLLVDDDFDQLAIFRAFLEKEGFEVLTAQSGSEGLEILENVFVDAVVCDMNMPEINGTEFSRRVRALRGTRGLPLLAFSASSLVPELEVLEAGATGFFEKTCFGDLVRELRTLSATNAETVPLLKRIQERY